MNAETRETFARRVLKFHLCRLVRKKKKKKKKGRKNSYPEARARVDNFLPISGAFPSGLYENTFAK